VWPQPLLVVVQVPQYLLVTAGEVLFSITGLELAYSQAPSSMTAVVSAAWLVTDATGESGHLPPCPRILQHTRGICRGIPPSSCGV